MLIVFLIYYYLFNSWKLFLVFSFFTEIFIMIIRFEETIKKENRIKRLLKLNNSLEKQKELLKKIKDKQIESNKEIIKNQKNIIKSFSKENLDNSDLENKELSTKLIKENEKLLEDFIFQNTNCLEIQKIKDEQDKLINNIQKENEDLRNLILDYKSSYDSLKNELFELSKLIKVEE